MGGAAFIIFLTEHISSRKGKNMHNILENLNKEGSK